MSLNYVIQISQRMNEWQPGTPPVPALGPPATLPLVRKPESYSMLKGEASHAEQNLWRFPYISLF